MPFVRTGTSSNCTTTLGTLNSPSVSSLPLSLSLNPHERPTQLAVARMAGFVVVFSRRDRDCEIRYANDALPPPKSAHRINVVLPLFLLLSLVGPVCVQQSSPISENSAAKVNPVYGSNFLSRDETENVPREGTT